MTRTLGELLTRQTNWFLSTDTGYKLRTLRDSKTEPQFRFHYLSIVGQMSWYSDDLVSQLSRGKSTISTFNRAVTANERP